MTSHEESENREDCKAIAEQILKSTSWMHANNQSSRLILYLAGVGPKLSDYHKSILATRAFNDILCATTEGPECRDEMWGRIQIEIAISFLINLKNRYPKTKVKFSGRYLDESEIEKTEYTTIDTAMLRLGLLLVPNEKFPEISDKILGN